MSQFVVELYSRIKAVAADDPERVALIEGERNFTYRQFVELISKVFRDISKAELRPNCRVGIFLANSIEAYGAIYALALHGITYVPLATDDPPARTMELIGLASLSCVLCSSSLATDLAQTLQFTEAGARPQVLIIDGADDGLDGGLDRDGISSLQDSDLAPESNSSLYMLFTSGSTGAPKGVLIDAFNVENFVRWASEYFEITKADIFLAHPRLTFDLSVFNLFVPFLSGAAVRIVRPGVEQIFPGSLFKLNVTIALTAPRITGLLKDAGQLTTDAYPSLRHMIFCGEQLLAAQVHAWMSTHPSLTVHNVYGPTECTVACTVHTIARDDAVADPVSIGRAIPNMDLMLVDSSGTLLSGEAEGDLVISGAGVSREGYWRYQSDRFFNHPQFGRCFQTGDLVRRDKNGDYYWKARLDHQVKVRGHRVELGEVESVLSQERSVLDVVCVYDEERELLVAAATIAPNVDQDGCIAELKKLADSHLPIYMRPAEYIIFDQMPRDRNGKADRSQIKKKAPPSV